MSYSHPFANYFCKKSNDHVMTPAFCADAGAETGEPAANDQNIGVNDFHTSGFGCFTVAGPTNLETGGAMAGNAPRRAHYVRNRIFM
jgi:hypothetical protein